MGASGIESRPSPRHGQNGRGVALLRKNALFVGHDEGGQNLAILLTIVSTCVLHGVEPRRYLADVIVRVNVPGNTVDELLPWNWKPTA